jgi:hypothetical protein
MTRWLGFCCLALVVIACDACESSRGGPAAPSPPADPSQSGPPPAPTIVAVRVEGRVIDAETEESIPHATVGNAGVCYPGPCGPGPTSTTADENGMFVLTVNVPQAWRELLLSVGAAGYEPTRVYVTPTSTRELRLLRTLTIRPGESIDMRVFSGSYVCGDESHLCRRVFIESSGGSIDVEVVPADAERDVGLFVNHPLIVTSYQRRVTVSGGEVWIYAAGAERTGVHSGVLAMFEQRVTVTAHRH